MVKIYSEVNLTVPNMLQLISKHKLSRPLLHAEALPRVSTDKVQVNSILKAMGGLESVMHTLTRSASKNQSLALLYPKPINYY